MFGQDKPVTTSKVSGIAANDWKYADLKYWDANTHTTNTASYGAGAWQNDATAYGTDEGLETLSVRTYTPGAIAQIRAGALQPEALTAEGVYSGHWDFATVTGYYNTGGFTDAAAAHARAFPTDVWAPAAPDQDGDITRTHTTTEYTALIDTDAAGLPRMLPKVVTVTEASSAASRSAEPTVNR